MNDDGIVDGTDPESPRKTDPNADDLITLLRSIIGLVVLAGMEKGFRWNWRTVSWLHCFLLLIDNQQCRCPKERGCTFV
jgi:hypothetical protein